MGTRGTSLVIRHPGSSVVVCAWRVTSTSIAWGSAPSSGPTSASAVTEIASSTFPMGAPTCRIDASHVTFGLARLCSAKSSTPTDLPGPERRTPESERAATVRRVRRPGDDPALFPRASRPCVERRDLGVLVLRLRDRAGPQEHGRKPAARKHCASLRSGPARGDSQDHRRDQSARHGDPPTAQAERSRLRSRCGLRAVRLDQRRRVRRPHEDPH